MSLARFSRERCVALSSNDSAYDAARAMAENHIGSVVVFSQGRIAGMVTDRDLALRVIGGGLDSWVPLGEIMTSLPAMLDIDDDPEQALELMRELRIRRIPLLDEGRLVGMITLDDLLVSRDVSLERLAEIVEEQLAQPAGRKPAGAIHPIRTGHRRSTPAARHEARAAQTMRRFTGRLCSALGLNNRTDALQAFDVVATALVRRISPGEAEDFVAQLPSSIREQLLDEIHGPDRAVTLERIEDEMAGRLKLEREDAARMVARVGEVLGELVGEGELDQMRAQLPRHLKPLLGRHAERDGSVPTALH